MSVNELERLRGLGWRSPERDACDKSLGVIEPPSSEDGNYPATGFDVLLAGVVSGYWFDHRAERIARALRESGDQTLWDVGAGLGANAIRLTKSGFEVLCIEPNLRAADSIRDNGLMSFASTLDQMEFPADSLSAIGLFDVLEHLREPSMLLAEASRVLAPGGRLHITVPALPILWSEEDEFAGHDLRYTKRSLHQLARRSGFREVTSEYLFGSLALAALVTRTLPYRLGVRRSEVEVKRQMRQQLNPPPLVQQSLRKILAAEAIFSRKLQLPFGSSIFATWTKEQ